MAIGGVIVLAVTTYMAFIGASASWQYYLTADECASGAAELVDRRVRVSGRVAADSLEIAPDRSHARFLLAGTDHVLTVRCASRLPDNLSEGIDVVVEGRLDSQGTLRGEKVLTRCASKYSPAETASNAVISTANASTKETR